VDVTLGGIGVGLGMGPEMVSESLQPDPRAVETATEKSNLGMLTRACAKQLVESSTGSDCVVTGIIVSSLARARRGRPCAASASSSRSRRFWRLNGGGRFDRPLP